MIPQSRLLPLVLASALFMEQMDSTIIATSLPDIAADLGTSPVSLKLAFTTYLLGLTVTLPISGWMADRFGARLIFRIAIVIFTLASLACGFAEGLGTLVAARALQGVGGALMVAVSRIILLRSVEKSELLQAISWLTIPALIGPIIGPPIGGFITTTYDWRWIFWMNLPIGIIAFAAATWLMPPIKDETPTPLDVKGFLLSGIGLTLAIFGFTVLGRDLFAGWQVAAMITAGVLMLWAYIRHARVHPAPLLDLRLMSIPTFRHSVIGGNIFRIVIGATPFLLPLMLQLGFGYSAFETGLITFASTLGALLMKFTVAPIVRHFGYRKLLIVNGLLCCATIAAKGLFDADTPYIIMISTLIIAGFLRSLQFSSLNTLVYADIERPDMSRANALHTVLQQLSMAMGVAIAAFMLDGLLWWDGRTDLVAADFSFVLIALSAFSALGIFSFLRLKPNAGSNISGKVDDA